MLASNPLFEKARNSLTESESVVTSDVEARMRKLQKQIDLKHENLPAARQFKIDEGAIRDSNQQFDISLDSSIDYLREIGEINQDINQDAGSKPSKM